MSRLYAEENGVSEVVKCLLVVCEALGLVWVGGLTDCGQEVVISSFWC